MEESAEHRFAGVLYEVPSNYPHIMNVAVDVPASVSDAFGVRGHVPVDRGGHSPSRVTEPHAVASGKTAITGVTGRG